MKLSKKLISDNAFGRALGLDLRRAVFSWRFALGILMMLTWMAFNAAQQVKTYDRAVFAGVIQLIRLGLEGEFSTGPVLLSIATIPYAFSHLTERDCGFALQVKERVGVTIYGVCKAIAVAASAFLMAVAALWLYIAILSAMGIPHTVRGGEVWGTYAAMAYSLGPGWYYCVKALHLGLICAQAAVFSLMIMSWIPNAYVGFLAPLIGYYMVFCVFNIASSFAPTPLWALVSPLQIFFGQPLRDPVFGYVWTVLVLVSLMLVFGIRFLLQLGKEYVG